MTRRGKIARLPQSIREQVNRRLENGVEGKQIVEWLNGLPKVKAVMAAQFDGQPVNNSNPRTRSTNCSANAWNEK